MRRLPIFALAATAMILAACKKPANDGGEYLFIDPEGWRYGDTLSYVLPLTDSVATGDITIALRHTNDYLYSNLFVEATVVDSLSTTVDTLNIEMADNFGRWYGSGIGTDYRLTHPLASGRKLHRPAKVYLRHVMRVETLPDIEQIGIEFFETPTH